MVDELISKQIVALLSDGATSVEVAEHLGIEEALVKLVAERNQVGTPEDRDIDDDQLKVLRKHAYNLALGAEDDATQAKMVMFLLERDKPSKKAESASPLVQINQAIVAANSAYDKLVKEMTQKVIDAPSS